MVEHLIRIPDLIEQLSLAINKGDTSALPALIDLLLEAGVPDNCWFLTHLRSVMQIKLQPRSLFSSFLVEHWRYYCPIQGIFLIEDNVRHHPDDCNLTNNSKGFSRVSPSGR